MADSEGQSNSQSAKGWQEEQCIAEFSAKAEAPGVSWPQNVTTENISSVLLLELNLSLSITGHAYFILSTTPLLARLYARRTWGMSAFLIIISQAPITVLAFNEQKLTLN